jgi:hypothetical protein
MLQNPWRRNATGYVTKGTLALGNCRSKELELLALRIALATLLLLLLYHSLHLHLTLLVGLLLWTSVLMWRLRKQMLLGLHALLELLWLKLLHAVATVLTLWRKRRRLDLL